MSVSTTIKIALGVVAAAGIGAVAYKTSPAFAQKVTGTFTKFSGMFSKGAEKAAEVAGEVSESVATAATTVTETVAEVVS